MRFLILWLLGSTLALSAAEVVAPSAGCLIRLETMAVEYILQNRLDLLSKSGLDQFTIQNIVLDKISNIKLDIFAQKYAVTLTIYLGSERNAISKLWTLTYESAYRCESPELIEVNFDSYSSKM